MKRSEKGLFNKHILTKSERKNIRKCTTLKNFHDSNSNRVYHGKPDNGYIRLALDIVNDN